MPDFNFNSSEPAPANLTFSASSGAAYGFAGIYHGSASVSAFGYLSHFQIYVIYLDLTYTPDHAPSRRCFLL